LPKESKSRFSFEYANVFSNILAKEQISISISATAKTASFNLNSRTLTLPVWEGSTALLRFLLCHEISHAMLTPPEDWDNAIHEKPQNQQIAYKDVLNVFEDARIDRLMQEKYITMRKWYALGMHELAFDLNIWGMTENSDWSRFELLDRINLYFKTIYNSNPFNVTFDKEDQDKWIEPLKVIRTFADVKLLADKFFAEMPEDKKEKSESQTIFVMGDFNTDSNESVQDINIPMVGVTIGYIPQSSNPYIPNKKPLIEVPDSDYRKVVEIVENNQNYLQASDTFDITMDSYNSLINKMVSVFQMKKQGRLISRAQIAKSGLIDPLKLHSYSINEDIMLRNTIIDKQKNHGFIMIVDMSSSMRRVWTQVVEHLFVLTTFCKKINVPFESYGFRNGHYQCDLVKCMFSLVPMISSKDSLKQIKDKSIRFKSFYDFTSTPLTSAVHYSKTLTLDFIQRHHVDVMNVIFLTDGGCTNTILAENYVDKVSKFIASTDENYVNAVPALVKILRKRTNARVYNYFVTEMRDKDFEFMKDYEGWNGYYKINKSIISKNPTFFVKEFIENMV
jgi:hypothetical protein